MKRLLFALALAATPFLFTSCAAASSLMQTLGRTLGSVGRLATGS